MIELSTYRLYNTCPPIISADVSLAISDDFSLTCFLPINRFLRMIFVVNELIINDDLSPKRDDIYPDCDIYDNLITMANEKLTTNCDYIARTSFLF